MSKIISVMVGGAVCLLAIYVGAVVGIHLALDAAPKFVPQEDSYVYQSDIDFSNGAAITPNYNLQPAMYVR